MLYLILFSAEEFSVFGGGGFYSQAQRYNYYSSVHNTCFKPFYSFSLIYCFSLLFYLRLELLFSDEFY